MLALLFIALLADTLQTCKVGDDYQSVDYVSNIGGRWYLNAAVPATCSGSINSYEMDFYDNSLSEDTTYRITLTVWRPINSTTYEIDSSTTKQYTYTHDDKRRRKRGLIGRSTSISPAVGVRKGSVIGVYLRVIRPLPVIGNRPGETQLNGVPIGACVTTASSSTTILTCTGSNQVSTNMIHAEADINIVTCNTPPTVSNAIYSQLDGDTQYGARVQYNCSTGYNINGNDIISCLLNASWSSPTPSCSLVNCGNPGEPANGYTNDNVFTYQSTVQYHCNEGYQLSGDSSIECTANGNWNNTLPNCAKINCTDPGMPTNGERTGTLFTFNSTVLYSCDTGYTITGAPSLTCLSNGSWDASVPSCDIVNCGDPGEPTNGESLGDVFTYGAEVVYSCNDQYSIVGAQAITCQSNGYWSDALPSCVYIDCTDPGIPDNGLRTSSNFSFNSSVNFTCYPGYQLTGSDAITCGTDGSWSDDIPSCIITYCSAPMSPANGNVSYTSLSVNSSIYFTCNTGYTLTGNTNITCLPNTQWSNVIPTCTITVCPLTPPSHGYFTPNSNQYNYGTIVSVNCNPRYGLVGVSTLTCNATGQWSNNIPLCIAIASSTSSVTNSQEFTSTQQSSSSSTINSNSYESTTGSTVIPSNNASASLGIGVGISSTVILLVLILLILFVLIVFIIRFKRRTTKNSSYYESNFISSTGNNLFATENSLPLVPVSSDVIASSNEDFNMSINELYSEVKGHSSVFKMSRNESYMKKEDIRVPFYEPAHDRIKIIAQIRKSKSVLIQFDSLRLTSSLGSGQFGNVCKGQWKKPNGDTIDVAVKMLQDGASEQEKIKFLQEAAILSQFTHDNVIKLHGVVSDDEHPMIVFEYMSKGDLDHLLQKMITNPGELVHHDTPALLLSFCQQVCLGMIYLSSKGFVHRDLAARNILVSADNICKINDFGLSRDLEDENYYMSHKGAVILVKWTAPEALNYRKYSTASDVWSYGCLMYEIWSIGRKPYESDSNISALEKICSGERLPPPPGCPEAIYSLMISCWHPVASERPNFHEIMVSLLQPNKNILTIPESALSSHPQAGSLGGTLKAGKNMYSEIQNCYSDTMDTAL